MSLCTVMPNTTQSGSSGVDQDSVMFSQQLTLIGPDSCHPPNNKTT